MSLQSRLTELEARMAAVEAVNQQQQKTIVQLLITSQMVQPNRDMITEIRTRIWPFFTNGADRNHEINDWLTAQVPPTP